MNPKSCLIILVSDVTTDDSTLYEFRFVNRIQPQFGMELPCSYCVQSTEIA